MEKQAAAIIAERALADLAGSSGEALALLDDRVVQTPRGWLFFYQTVEHLTTGDPLAALAGNGPILVEHDGSVRILASSSPWQDQIAD